MWLIWEGVTAALNLNVKGTCPSVMILKEQVLPLPWVLVKTSPEYSWAGFYGKCVL